MISFNSILKTTAVTLAFLSSNILLSSNASAQTTTTTINSTFFADITADAGSFAPVALGEDISLNACGSSVHLVGNNTAFGNSVCNLTNIGLYSVNWFAKNVTTGMFTWLTGGFGSDENLSLSSVPDGTAAANSTTTTGTGAGTFFSNVGTYAIGVLVGTGQSSTNVTQETVTANNVNFFNIGIQFSSDNAANLGAALAAGGNLNQHAIYGSNFEVTQAVSVPEPETIFLLIPMLGFIASRQRRRKTIHKLAANV